MNENLDRVYVGVTVVLSLVKRHDRGRLFSPEEAEMHAGQCVETALREALQTHLDRQDAPFTATIIGIDSKKAG